MRLFLFSSLLLCSSILIAQEAGYIIVQGQVVDQRTQNPLPYAHVGISARGIGTTTGYDGAFTLKVPAQYREERVQVSYIGYKTAEAGLGQLSRQPVIKLEPVPAMLQEVIVMDEQRVEDIIRRAVRQIPDNYPSRPTNATAFYRESKTDSKGDYIYLAEGVLQLYKESYQNKKEGQIGLLQGRKVALAPEEELRSNARFSSGHLAADRFDVVKNRADFLDERFFPAYTYRLDNVTAYEGRPVFVVGFDRTGDDPDGRMKGKIYIDTLSYAFIRAEFEIRPEAQGQYDDYPFYTGNWKANRYFVDYRMANGKWFLKDALREGVWQDGGVYTNEIVVTEVVPGRGKPVPYMERLGRDDRFLNITGAYDESFWASYNTAPLHNEKLSETVQQFRNQDKAREVFDTAYMALLQRAQDSVVVLTPQTPRGEPIIAYVPKENTWVTESAILGAHFSYGAGAHALPTSLHYYRLNYLSAGDLDQIIGTEGEVSAREGELLYQLALDVAFKDRYLLRWALSRDFGNSIYRESAIGLGLQYNLTKRVRPVYLRPIVQYSRLRYARFVGQADNDFGNFKADGKNFKANKVNMYYGEINRSVKFTLEAAVELNPSRELFVRGSYHLPFQQQAQLFLWERQRVFRKRVHLPVDEQVAAFRGTAPYNGTLTPNEGTFSLTIGLLLK
ncbi:carboxypeptidase-like regulatory domain-containing protein [Phaeodactylibacter luteus]|nr:carboxypeptidase-like regulatory domain-containing protein [Phaeodactylibacter luteus]